MALKDLIIAGIVLLLGIIGAVYVIPKADSKLLNQHILQDLDTVNLLRNAAQEYAGLNPQGDYSGINIEQLKQKGILPSNVTVVGNGDTAEYHPPYDNKEKITMVDPNAGDATKSGLQFQITIDAAATKMTDQEKEIWEKKLEESFKRSGGLVDTFGSYTDGKIAVTFD